MIRMANSLSLLSKPDNSGIFECPHCHQTINLMDAQCPFCSTVIDKASAQIAVAKMSRINQACSDASFLRTMALSIFIFMALMIVPFFSWIGLGGFYFLAVAVPFMSIRWWYRFYGLKAEDSDLNKAKITVIIISALCLLPWLRIFLH